MPLQAIKTPPETRLAGQISQLSDTLESLLSLASQAGAETPNANVRRHAEIDKALKVAERSAGLAVALSRLRGGSLAISVHRGNGPAPSPAAAEAATEEARIAAIEAEIDRELDRDLPVIAPHELDTITNEVLHARCGKRWAVRQHRRALYGLPSYPDDEPEAPTPVSALAGSNVAAAPLGDGAQPSPSTKAPAGSNVAPARLGGG
jgi:hypothetical protein